MLHECDIIAKSVCYPFRIAINRSKQPDPMETLWYGPSWEL